MAAVFEGGQHVILTGKCLTVDKTVGQGGFGVVYKVRERESGRSYALKDIHCEDTSAIRQAIKEVQTLSKVSHDNVLKFVAADQYEYKGVHVLILTEFCFGGNLNERLARESSQQTNMKWMTQLASALSHLHDLSIVHRDLKPENVLLTDPQRDDIKIGDFGLAREYLALKCIKMVDFVAFFINYMETVAGTVYWMAPEVFDQQYTDEADVFSLGCIFHAILVRDSFVGAKGEKYYGAFVSLGQGERVGLGYAMARLKKSFMVEFPANSVTSKFLRKITIDALQKNPRDRPRARELCDRIRAVNC